MTRRRRWLLVVMALLAALVAWALWPPSERPFYDYVAERRAAGLPTTFDELLGPMPPDADNGAEELAASIPWVLKECGPSTSWRNSPYDLDMNIDDGPTRELIEGETPAAVRIRPWTERRDAVLARPRLRFAVGFDANGARTLKHVTLLQNAQRLLTMQSQAEDGPQRRLDAIRATLLLARRIEPETLVNEMVASAIVSGGVASLRRGVEWERIDPVAARAACDELLRGSQTDRMRRAFRTHAVEFLAQYRELVEGRAVPPNAGASWWQRLSRHVERLTSRARGLPEFPELEPGMPRTVVGICRGLDAAAAAEPRAGLDLAAVQRLDPSGAMRECGIDGMVVKLMRTAFERDAQTRLARVALAVAAHRAENGEFPASLADLRAEFPDGVPADPYTGAAFEYAPTADGVRISSAGRVAGTPAPEEDTRRERLLVWELKR